MDIERRENESLWEYCYRLIQDRKDMDLDYIEIEKLMIGDTPYSSDNVRKAIYFLNILLKKFIEEEKEKSLKGIRSIERESFIKELEEKKLELEKERKKLQATKIEYNRNLRNESRTELLYENVKQAIERLPLPEFKEIQVYKNDGEYLLTWADLHYGADFKSENNIYSREECKRRMELIAARVKNMCVDKGISNLTVLGLGDDIQGLLRLSDTKINDIAVVECVVEVSRLIANVLNNISEVTNIKYYHTMASNHSQTRPLTAKPDLIKEDMEVIIGNYIKDLLLSNNRVEVILSNRDYHTFELAGQNIIAMHGHQVKNVKMAIRDYSQLHRKFYDLCFIGHLHGGESKPVGESINGSTEIHVIPSVVGSDPYSDTLKVGSKAMAKLFKLEKWNGITEEYSIILN